MGKELLQQKKLTYTKTSMEGFLNLTIISIQLEWATIGYFITINKFEIMWKPKFSNYRMKKM